MPAQERTEPVETCLSLAELFSKLPSFVPVPCTVASARGLVYEIVTFSVSVLCKCVLDNCEVNQKMKLILWEWVIVGVGDCGSG